MMIICAIDATKAVNYDDLLRPLHLRQNFLHRLEVYLLLWDSDDFRYVEAGHNCLMRIIEIVEVVKTVLERQDAKL